MRKLESLEQKRVILWRDANKIIWPQLEWLFHVPNGGKRSGREALEFSNLGVLPGISDLILLVSSRDYHYFCGEMKAPGVNKLDKEQIKFKNFVVKNNGFYCVHNNAQNMVNEIKLYLNLE